MAGTEFATRARRRSRAGSGRGWTTWARVGWQAEGVEDVGCHRLTKHGRTRLVDAGGWPWLVFIWSAVPLCMRVAMSSIKSPAQREAGGRERTNWQVDAGSQEEAMKIRFSLRFDILLLHATAVVLVAEGRFQCCCSCSSVERQTQMSEQKPAELAKKSYK